MKKIITLLLMLAMPISLAIPSHAAEGFRSGYERFIDRMKPSHGYVPRAAEAAVEELDRQIGTNLGFHARHALRIAFTVSSNLNDFNKTNPLSRQMSEEVARGLKQKGYKVLEIRKGSEVVMTPGVGELFLTRNRDKLSKQSIASELILVGTYTVSKKGIRFNLRLLHTNSTEVIAMATTTVPMYPEIKPLLIENKSGPLAPTVGTKLSL